MEQPYRNKIFIDSGAHGLYGEHIIKANHKNGYDFFGSKDFFVYLDRYAAFIKNNNFDGVYASVDVIFNPELTWKSQKYLEDIHGLAPIPTIHHGTDLKWLKRYLDRGYSYIALGGLGQEVSKASYTQWADRAFDMICDTPNRTPSVKVHGFAMTSYYLMKRYPWYSVDSASWLKAGANGSLIVPYYNGSKFVFDAQFSSVRISSVPNEKTQNIQSLVGKKKISIICEYLAMIGYDLGESLFKVVPISTDLKKGERFVAYKDKDMQVVEQIVVPGVSNTAKLRIDANAEYFVRLAQCIPAYPTPFKKIKMKDIWSSF